jgi:hypothetical protein
LNGNQLTVDVPQSITLGLCQVIVRKNIVDNKGNVVDVLDSYPTPIEPTGGYLFAALPGDGQVAVVDTRPTITQGPTTVTKPDLNQLVARIPLAGGTYAPYPQYVAATADGTRAYVTDPVNHGIAVIDTIALQEVNAVATESRVNEIPLPANAAPGQITIDPQDGYAYVTDESSENEATPNGTSLVYVIDIDPSSPTYNELVHTIAAPQAPFGLHGLAVNSDGTQLFVAVPNMLGSEHATRVLPTGHLQVIDLTPDANGEPAWELLNSIDVGSDPYGVTAGPDDAITFTDYLFNAEAFGIITKGSTTATWPSPGPQGQNSFLFNGNLNDEFEVNNYRAVAVTPDGKYAFVAGYDIPDDEVSSHNHGAPAFNPAGSNIGVISNPFTNPQLVAATRSIPNGFPYDLAVSPDGQYLYASFSGIPVTGGEGAIMVYDINQIISTLATANPQSLKVVGIDSINHAIDVDANYQLPPSVQYSPNLLDSYAPPFISVPAVAATATNPGKKGAYSATFNITNPGSEYPANQPPTVTLTGAGGSGARAHAVITNGTVSAIVLDNPGSDYTSYGVEITGPSGNPPIATGGIPHGIAVQPPVVAVTEDPIPGGLIQVDLRTLLKNAAPPVTSASDFWLDIGTVKGGQVALTQDEYTALATGKPTRAQQEAINNGLPEELALEPAQRDILTTLPPNPASWSPGNPVPGSISLFANTGVFYLTAEPESLPYNTPAGRVAKNNGYSQTPKTITGEFYFKSADNIEPATFTIHLNADNPVKTPPALNKLGNAFPTSPAESSPDLSNIQGPKFTDSSTYTMGTSGYQLGGPGSAGFTFTVGQAFTARQESLGLNPYVPQVGKKSGITIGFGYDIGQQNAMTVAGYFWQAGISVEQAQSYIAYINAEQGNNVNNTNRVPFSTAYLKQYTVLAGPDLQTIYLPQAVALFYELYQKYKTKTINQVGQQVWNNLAQYQGVQDVLVDLAYNYGTLPAGAKTAAQSSAPVANLLTYLNGLYTPKLHQLQSSLANLQSQLAALESQSTPPTPAITAAIDDLSQKIDKTETNISNWTTVSRPAQQIIHIGFTPEGQTQPEFVSGSDVNSSTSAGLTDSQLQAVSAQSIAGWAAAGAVPSQIQALQNARYQVGALAAGEVGSTTGNVVTISPDAGGAGWFIDPTPADNLEFGQAVAPTELDATPGSPAFGKVDLLSVVEHEMGHVLGLPDVANAAEPNDLMDISIAPGVRRLPQAADLQQLTAAPTPTTLPVQSATLSATPTSQGTAATTTGKFAPVTWAASVLPSAEQTTPATSAGTGATPATPQLERLADTPSSDQPLTNGGFNQGSGNLQGWLVSDPNQVTVNAQHQAVIKESASTIEVDLSQAFVIPTTAKTLTFTLDGTTNDHSVASGVTPDAFGVALLNPQTLKPLGSTIDGVTDSYYIKDLAPSIVGGMAGSGVSVSAPNADGARQVGVNLDDLGGQPAELVFRFIAGSDASQLGGSVTVSDVSLGDSTWPRGGLPPPPISVPVPPSGPVSGPSPGPVPVPALIPVPVPQLPSQSEAGGSASGPGQSSSEAGPGTSAEAPTVIGSFTLIASGTGSEGSINPTQVVTVAGQVPGSPTLPGQSTAGTRSDFVGPGDLLDSEVDDFWPWSHTSRRPAAGDLGGQERPDAFWPWLEAPQTGGRLEQIPASHVDTVYARGGAAVGENVVHAVAEARATDADAGVRRQLAVDGVFASPEEGWQPALNHGEGLVLVLPAARAPVAQGITPPPKRPGLTLGGLLVGVWHLLGAPLQRRKDRRPATPGP